MNSVSEIAAVPVQMCSLQLYSSYGGFDQSHLGCSLSSVQKQLHSGVAFSSSFFGTDLCLQNGGSFIVCNRPEKRCLLQKKRVFGVFAMSSTNGSAFKMNLNEYLVTLEKPLGLRFAISVDGKVFVHALKKGVNSIEFMDSVLHFFRDMCYMNVCRDFVKCSSL